MDFDEPIRLLYYVLKLSFPDFVLGNFPIQIGKVNILGGGNGDFMSTFHLVI